MQPLPELTTPTSSPEPGFDQTAQRAALSRALLILCVLMVAHGSIYPWRFATPESWEMALYQMFVERLWWSGRGDAAINILLFLPIGVLGLLAFEGSTAPTLMRVGLQGLSALVFAIALQLIQLWIPARTAAVSDVLWNAVGTVFGMLLAGPSRRLLDQLIQLQLLRHPAALVMGLLWVSALCWPLMPSHSLRHVAEAMRPLWRATDWSFATVGDVSLGLAAVLLLTRTMHRRWLYMGTLVACVVAGRLLGRDLQLTQSIVLGLIVGVILGMAMLRASSRVAAMSLGSLALIWYAARALYPFGWAAEPTEFHWIPFLASLQGPRVALTTALVWALFWSGIWMCVALLLQWNTTRVAIALAAYLLAIEFAHQWLSGQIADITPVAFPAIWWWIWRRWHPLHG